MRAAVVLGMSVLLLACTRPPVTSPTPRPLPPPTMHIEVSDLIEVRIFDEPQLSGEFRVGPDGTVLLPLVGSIKIAGLTPPAASLRVEEQFRKEQILREPKVSVYVKQSNAKKIRVLGQVVRPGTYPYSDAMDVVEAITSAGGFTPFADPNDVDVIRLVGEETQRYHVRVRAISEGKEKSFPLQPGDTINVPERIF